MSNVYKHVNSIAGASGVVFGGGGGGGGRSRHRDRPRVAQNAFSGPALESERRRTGHSNGQMNAQMQEDLRVDPPDHSQTVGNVAGTVGFLASKGNPVGLTASLVGLVANNWPEND